jgi:hypothetical protein
LFSTFPDGLPGIGLLLLRIVVAAAAAILGWLHLVSPDASPAAGLVALVFGIGGLLVLAGLLTPIGLTLILLATLLIWPHTSHPDFWDAPIPLAFFAGIAIAVGLLGPGWFSFDRAIFGRREVIFPRSSE